MQRDMSPRRRPCRAGQFWPGALGVSSAFIALAMACGGGGGTAQSGAPGTAAPSAQTAPAAPLPPLESLQVNSPDPSRSGADSSQRISQARASSQSKPEAIETRALLGAELYDGGKSAEAERVYKDLLKQHPEHVASLVGLAQILIDRDDLDGAGPLIDRALKANPESIPALQRRVALLLARDQAAEAVSVAQTALRLDAKSAALQAALGDAQRAFGDLPKAIAAHEGIAEALLAAKRLEEARRHAEEALRRGRDVHALLKTIDRAGTP